MYSHELATLYYCGIGHELVDPSLTVCKTVIGKKQTIQFKCPLELDCTLLPYVHEYDTQSNPMLRIAKEQAEKNSITNI